MGSRCGMWLRGKAVYKNGKATLHFILYKGIFYMYFKKKEKPIKLGQIKNDKVEKMSDSATWNLDYTICVFIRDALKKFKENRDGFPAILLETMSEEEADKYYAKIIDTIIYDLDYYLTPVEELMTAENRALLEQFYSSNLDPFEAAENKDFATAQKTLGDIAESQNRHLNEAFDALKEWLPSFWW